MSRFPLLISSSLGALALVSTQSSAQQNTSSTETFTYDSLGRLIVADTDGGANNSETHSICYDEAGNRIEYAAASDGTASACVNDGTGSGGGTPPPPPPTPPPPPPNNPPITVNDSISGACDTSSVINLVANDTDPESNYPLTLVSIVKTGGTVAWASVLNSTSATVNFGFNTTPYNTATLFEYTVEDSLGAPSTGILTVYTYECQNPN